MNEYEGDEEVVPDSLWEYSEGLYYNEDSGNCEIQDDSSSISPQHRLLNSSAGNA